MYANGNALAFTDLRPTPGCRPSGKLAMYPNLGERKIADARFDEIRSGNVHRPDSTS
jgi:hypothetical protein